VTYDVAILDILLGSASGLDLLAEGSGDRPAHAGPDADRPGQRRPTRPGPRARRGRYLVKPFAIEELVARLRALGRRPALTADVWRYGDLEYDQGAREISVREARLPCRAARASCRSVSCGIPTGS
jgi:two-component system response regulator QseB